MKSTKNGKFGKGRSALSIVRKFFPEVTEVLDGDKDIDIEVTAKDAKAAKKMDHNNCALAVACSHSLPIDGVVVSVSTCYLIKGAKARRYRIPEAAAREIISFDRAGLFDPGAYKLKAPTETSRLGHMHGANTHSPTRDTSKQLVAHRTGGIRAALTSRL